MRRAVSSRLMTSFGGASVGLLCGFVGGAPVALTRSYGIAAATPIRLALPSSDTNVKKPVGEKASFTDPDMTHFRHTATPHPLYDKPDVNMPRQPQDPAVAHPGAAVNAKHPEVAAEWENPQTNAVWSKEELLAVSKTHKKPKDLVDRIALTAIKIVRGGFDILSGYAFGRITPNKILRRVLFLETVAGIPGMVAGTLRHLESLRRMKRDYGWIHTLLEEAENERMHMLVFMKLYQPNVAFRGCVLVAQGIFWNAFFLAYLASPRLCHRFVGYLEEEAVRTYTHVLEVMKSQDPRDAAVVEFGKQPAHEIALRYWKLPADATMYDVVLAVRADEANHRDVNHVFATLKKTERNPFLDHKQGPAAKYAAEILKE